MENEKTHFLLAICYRYPLIFYFWMRKHEMLGTCMLLVVVASIYFEKLHYWTLFMVSARGKLAKNQPLCIPTHTLINKRWLLILKPLCKHLTCQIYRTLTIEHKRFAWRWCIYTLSDLNKHDKSRKTEEKNQHESVSNNHTNCSYKIYIVSKIHFSFFFYFVSIYWNCHK